MDVDSSGIKCKLYIIAVFFSFTSYKGQDYGSTILIKLLGGLKLFFFPLVNEVYAHMVLLFLLENHMS